VRGGTQRCGGEEAQGGTKKGENGGGHWGFVATQVN
jgi:hypothetical protein